MPDRFVGSGSPDAGDHHQDRDDEEHEVDYEEASQIPILKGKNWNKICDSGIGNDEFNLTVEYVKNRQFKNILYTDFYVSHLSFYQQNKTGINLNKLVNNYHTLFHTLEENENKN
jgi:hypothetical protein